MEELIEMMEELTDEEYRQVIDYVETLKARRTP